MRLFKLKYVLYILMLVFISGCTKKNQFPPVELPPTHVLSIQSSWAVINSSHLRLRVEPSVESGVKTTLWRSFVLEVVSRSSEPETLENETGYWYQIQYDGLQGWVFGAYITLYETKEEALNASRELR